MIKIIAHDTTMKIPIFNHFILNQKKLKTNKLNKLNNLNLKKLIQINFHD